MTMNKTLLDLFKRIQALTENPHWTADRRWTIADLAGRGTSVIVTAELEQQLKPMMTLELQSIVKRFLKYSFDGIEYTWANLTEEEKTFATDEEYRKLVAWVRS